MGRVPPPPPARNEAELREQLRLISADTRRKIAAVDFLMALACLVVFYALTAGLW